MSGIAKAIKEIEELIREYDRRHDSIDVHFADSDRGFYENNVTPRNPQEIAKNKWGERAEGAERALEILKRYVAEPRTGHWIFGKGDGRTCVDGHICSVCKTSYHTQVPYFAEYKYCPNCGAKMEADNA